ncbi:hypothetical protein [Leeuwenhoekiella marinoflava]|uniref:Uncharacterized protein n=2 Tax=Leeuwenhoekiella marinoflava TaxID=988 RepID=A0A4Q0PL29_9FLAO|nr:hypothetical protein [Leeuwenhoekiella marinoflava]RXG29198.1 hypothetical protein DSL99_2136 [Leeuwenhoekiella marinoflava]SHF34837.1 hypothetical protein SAMN02745246_02273 [Leeuwenhoekiella marinoflava DSM 3653]
MAKRGTPKNGKNKAKHTKLLKQKKEKLRKEKEARAAKLKAIITASKSNEA